MNFHSLQISSSVIKVRTGRAKRLTGLPNQTWAVPGLIIQEQQRAGMGPFEKWPGQKQY